MASKDGKWIAGAIKNPGALHKKLGVPQGEKIPSKKLAAAEKKGGVIGKEARLAETLKGFHHGGETMKHDKKEVNHDKRKEEMEKMKARHEKEKRKETKPEKVKESKVQAKKDERKGEAIRMKGENQDKRDERRGEMEVMKAKYEKSPFDKDKGVKEGSPADMKRDKVGIKLFIKSGEMPGGMGSIADRKKEAMDRAARLSKK